MAESKRPTASEGEGEAAPEPTTTPANFKRLVALLPELEAKTATPYLLSSIVHEDGIIPHDFDWPAWMHKGRRYLEPGGIERATIATCRKLLTVIVRQDRFVENSLGGDIASGLAARIVGRIAELRPGRA